MPPTIILIRHAQALHNDYSIHDPPLSDLGVLQCTALREKLQAEYADLKPEDVAIIASPMRRTLQTAMLGLGWLIERGVKAEANADWQENSAKPCDTGSPIPLIAPSFPLFTFSTVSPIYPDKTSPLGSPFFYTRSAILERGKRCLEALWNRPEKVVFVVSHSGFLRLGVVGWWFFNSDFRVFEFVDEEEGEIGGELIAQSVGDGRRRVRQRRETLEGGMGLSWTNRVELGSELPDAFEPEEDPAKERN